MPWIASFCECRQCLCRAIQSLIQNTVTLRATYTCQGNVGDLDNLLFYNIDPKGTVFGTAIRFLQFERIRGNPPQCPVTLNFAPTAHVRYEVMSLTQWNDNELAERQSGSCTSDDLKSLPHLWQLFRRNMLVGDTVEHQGFFRVQLIVSAPLQLALNLVDITTDCILDAFISACHHRAGEDIDLGEVVQALSRKYTWDSEEARRLLLFSGVLGHCRSVPRRNKRDDPLSLKWHPDDHNLIAGQIIRKDADNLSVCGRVLAP
jgi:hypothetical protein